jgi:hypothetical protein
MRPSRSLIVTMTAILLAAGPTPGNTQGSRPFRGKISWAVLLCQYRNSGTPPLTVQAVQNMVLQHPTESLDAYWKSASYQGVNLAGTVVRGWYTMPHDVSEYPARGRIQTWNDCKDAARTATTNPYAVSPGQLVATIVFPTVDVFGVVGQGAFFGTNVDLGGLAHETGHGLGYNHSFSDDPAYRNADWAGIGEYDDAWDVMSWANVFARTTASFGWGPPGVNAFHADRMGWIGRSRILTMGADGQASRTVTLAALNHPEASGFLEVRVPFDPGDLMHYYTVAFHRRDGWNTGIPGDIVLIHEVKKAADGQLYSYLLRQRTTARDPVQQLSANGVTIQIVNVDPAANQATVSVTTAMVDRCVQGYVWREASPSDHVCVTGAIRTQTAQENAAAAGRRNPNGGPYGPDTCLQGYVWRDAFAGDHVCVPGSSRAGAQADNAQVGARRNPARLAYGPNTCKQGYVWREADDADYVCVSGTVRSETRQENLLAASRRSPTGGPYGPDTCLQGFVWREAFPLDHVCVPGASRTRAAGDNGTANSRLLQP